MLLHLAAKACWPQRVPFPVVHVDTGHNFPEVLAFRDEQVAKARGPARGRLGAGGHRRGSIVEQPVPGATRNRLQTYTLLRVLEEGRYDAVFGGGRRARRRPGPKSASSPSATSSASGTPRAQRPELWNLYNTRHHPGEHFRVFPLSNWTELDIWQYIEEEGIELPSIYFAHRRQVFRRSGMLLAVGPFTKPREGVAAEEPFETTVRYRTVGDMTCTAAVESKAPARRRRSSPRRRSHGSASGGRRARTTASRRPPWRTASARATSVELLRFATGGSVDDGKSRFHDVCCSYPVV